MDAGNRRREDSGVIDIDELMRQANLGESATASSNEEAPKTSRKVTLIAPPKNEPPKSEVALESTPAIVTPIPRAPRVPGKLSVPAPPPRGPVARRSFERPLVALTVALALLGGGALYSRVRTMPLPKPAPVAVVAPHEAAPAAPRPLETANDTNDTTQPSSPSAGDLPSVPAETVNAPIAPSASTIALAKRPPTPKETDPVVTTTELIPESPTPRDDLGRAMHDVVGDGPSRDAKVERAPNRDARTLRPSPGAVIGALNAVLPAARECLGPDDAIRIGTVTFRSEGTVARVDLNGKRDSDDCVRSAVSRARIEPFADDTFTTRVTVRP